MRERVVVRVHLGVDVGVGVGIGSADRDVGDPAQRQPSDSLDDRKDTPDRVREATRQEVIVAHEKARRARQRDRVRGHEIRRAERADVPCLCRTRRVEDELLDGRLGACVVDDEEVGRGCVVGGVDFHAEGVEVVVGGVALQGNTVDGVGGRDM